MEEELVNNFVDIWSIDPETGQPCSCTYCKSLRKVYLKKFKNMLAWWDLYGNK